MSQITKSQQNNVVKSTQKILRGLASSPGLFMSSAFIIERQPAFIPTNKIKTDDIAKEIEKFNSAHDKLVRQFHDVIDKTAPDILNTKAILESNLLMLEDDLVLSAIREKIQSGFSAEYSVVLEFEKLRQMYLSSADAFIRERIIEIDQLKFRLVNSLRNKTKQLDIVPGSIVVAQFITPEEIVVLKEHGAQGIVTEIGGISSHCSILARNMELPHVIGVKNATVLINHNDVIIIDGYEGQVLVNPTAESIAFYQNKKDKETEYKQSLGELIKLPAETKDKKLVKLKANINFPDDIDAMQMVGAEGIGLVRTEYLVLKNGFFPDLNLQLEWYRKLITQTYPHIVTFRLYDVGSDKITEGLIPKEDNPALGFRGIRFLLQRRDIFEQQICAILQASDHKNANILIPMINTVEELLETKKLIEECKLKLLSKRIPFDKNIKVGVMIETPAAALISCDLAKHADFFSIGTNDLTQYTLAADRSNELVSNHYDTFHPAVLKLISMTVNSAKSVGIPVSVCGELAGYTAATEILIGLGVDELSVTPSILLEIKKRIRDLDYSQSSAKIQELLKFNCLKIEKN